VDVVRERKKIRRRKAGELRGQGAADHSKVSLRSCVG
jgi:hypothetical protein